MDIPVLLSHCNKKRCDEIRVCSSKMRENLPQNSLRLRGGVFNCSKTFLIPAKNALAALRSDTEVFLRYASEIMDITVKYQRTTVKCRYEILVNTRYQNALIWGDFENRYVRTNYEVFESPFLILSFLKSLS